MLPIEGIVTDIESIMDRSFDKAINKIQPSTCLVDIIQYDDHYALVAECPGYDENDIDIQIIEGVIELSGTRTKDDKKFVLRERITNKFVRKIVLPKDANPDSIEAGLEHGILTIKINKIEKTKPTQGRRVNITKK